MKKVQILLSALLVGFTTLTSLYAAPKTLNVSTSASKIVWLAKKVTGEHNGTVNISKGSLTVNGNKLVAGNFTIDLKSIVCKDLTDPGYNQKFIAHMSSGDFFEVEKFPTANFVISKVAGNEISGNMTIKGITKAITFPAQIVVSSGKVSATASIILDRTDYNIKFGSKKFFESIGDKAIYDDFNLTISLVSE